MGRTPRPAETARAGAAQLQKGAQNQPYDNIQRKCRGASDQKKMMQIFKERLKQGRDADDAWLMLGEQ